MNRVTKEGKEEEKMVQPYFGKMLKLIWPKIFSNLSKNGFQRTTNLTKSSTKIQSRYYAGACHISNSQTPDTIKAKKKREKNSKLIG